jgi:hypothetical protein
MLGTVPTIYGTWFSVINSDLVSQEELGHTVLGSHRLMVRYLQFHHIPQGLQASVLQ